MLTRALFVRLEAKPDKADEVVAFLKQGLQLAQQEATTPVWFARGRGLGASLLRSAEAEAAARGCIQVVLATRSFQAPGFYERMGYERKYTIEGRPKGYSDIIYAKRLP